MNGAPLHLRTLGPGDTHALGRALGRAALPLPGDGLAVTLRGDLGAGKTVFVQGLAGGIGLPPDHPVVSPTFTIARSNAVPGAMPSVTLHPVDAYRLSGPEELELIGFEEMWGEGRLLCVEWGERVADALPPDRIRIEIVLDGADPDWTPGALPRSPRRIRLTAEGAASSAVLARLIVPEEVERCS